MTGSLDHGGELVFAAVPGPAVAAALGCDQEAESGVGDHVHPRAPGWPGRGAARRHSHGRHRRSRHSHCRTRGSGREARPSPGRRAPVVTHGAGGRPPAPGAGRTSRRARRQERRGPPEASRPAVAGGTRSDRSRNTAPFAATPGTTCARGCARTRASRAPCSSCEYEAGCSFRMTRSTASCFSRKYSCASSRWRTMSRSAPSLMRQQQDWQVAGDALPPQARLRAACPG